MTTDDASSASVSAASSASSTSRIGGVDSGMRPALPITGIRLSASSTSRKTRTFQTASPLIVRLFAHLAESSPRRHSRIVPSIVLTSTTQIAAREDPRRWRACNDSRESFTGMSLRLLGHARVDAERGRGARRPMAMQSIGKRRQPSALATTFVSPLPAQSSCLLHDGRARRVRSRSVSRNTRCGTAGWSSVG